MSAATLDADTDRLPGYTTEQDAFHLAFQAELERMIDELPVSLTARVLDVPCGTGSYARALARRIGPGGHVTAADGSADYLAIARSEDAGPDAAPIDYHEADAYQLPYEDETFDLVWCAQSLISLTEPVAALREMRRVVRRGGVVAVLENDEHHHVLLPWPVELEPAIQAAIPAASHAKYGKASTLFASRYLRRMLTSAGLRPLRKISYTADRQAPLTDKARLFLASHLEQLREALPAHMDPDAARVFLTLTDPDSSAYMLDRADLEVTWLGAVHFGVRVD